MDKFEKAYLDIIQEQYHRKPLLGWNKNSFQKIMTKMLVKGMKPTFGNRLANQFDGYFVSKKIFSFKPVFKTKPVVTTGGAGRTLNVTMTYSYAEEDLKDLLCGQKFQDADKTKGGFLAKFKSFFKNKNNLGIIHNRTFSLKFFDLIKKQTFKEEQIGQEEKGDNDQNNSKNVGFQEADDSQKFKELAKKIRSSDSVSMDVILDFRKIKYIDKIKKKAKQFLNPNRVESYSGKVYLKFIIGGTQFLFQVTNDDDGITWYQYRTANMDPPTPIKDQLKKIWNNPTQGTGLVGLAAKKVGTGLKNTLFGSMASSTVQDESVQISFSKKYSMSNMDQVTPKSENDEINAESSVVQTFVKKQLESDKILVDCTYDVDQKKYNITILNKDKAKLINILLKLK